MPIEIRLLEGRLLATLEKPGVAGLTVLLYNSGIIHMADLHDGANFMEMYVTKVVAK